MAQERTIHFLHIGKNGGTAIGALAQRISAAGQGLRIHKHHHRVKLYDLPAGQDYIFAIRSPEARFRSGFYSRKREGRPRIHVPWSVDEAAAFAAFEHANDLAEALFEEGERGHRAIMALTSIGHCAVPQIAWFERCGFFLETRPPLAILRQSRLDDDCRALVALLGLDVEATLPRDPVRAHSNRYEGVPELSPRALANLRNWYSHDYAFVRMCEDHVAALERGQGRSR